MRKILFLFFILSVLICASQKKELSFQIKQLRPYCGGARPSPEMEAKARELQPFADQKLFIISEKGAKDSLITDAEGNFRISLKPGTYKVYEAWKFRKQTPNGEPISSVDKECLKKEWKKEDMKITFVNGNAQLKNNIEQGKCPWQHPCLVKKIMPE